MKWEKHSLAALSAYAAHINVKQGRFLLYNTNSTDIEHLDHLENKPTIFSLSQAQIFESCSRIKKQR